MPLIKRNINLIKLNYFFWGLWPLSALLAVHFEKITHSNSVAMLLFSVGSLTRTFLEIPTGIFADKFGRKTDILCANLLLFAGFFSFAVAGEIMSVTLLFVGAFLWGANEAFLSGTNEALMFETAEELGSDITFEQIYAKANSFLQLGAATGALSAGILAYFMPLNIIAWISIIPPLGQLCTSLFYIEPEGTKLAKAERALNKTSSFSLFITATKHLFSNKQLRFFASIEILDNALGMACHQFEGLYFKTLVANWLISIIRFTKQMWGVLSYNIVMPLRKIFPAATIYFASVFWNFFARTIGVFFNNVISPFVMASVNLSWGTQSTSYQDILQHQFTKKERSTMMSTIQFFSGLFLAVAYYLFGLLADFTTPRFAILIAVIIKAILIIVSIFIFKRKKKK